jgi:hypothetical protein
MSSKEDNLVCVARQMFYARFRADARDVCRSEDKLSNLNEQSCSLNNVAFPYGFRKNQF